MKKMLLSAVAFLAIIGSAQANFDQKTVVCDYLAIIYVENDNQLTANFVNVQLLSKLGNLEGGFQLGENVAIVPNDNAFTLSYPTENGKVTLDIEKTQYTISEEIFGVVAKEIRKCHPSLNPLFK